jgi:hypothetical protein
MYLLTWVGFGVVGYVTNTLYNTLIGQHDSYIRNINSQWCRPCRSTYQGFYSHRLSINRATKRGKEKSPSDGHCQCEKEMDDHLLACQPFLKESHEMTCLAEERTSILKINYINDIKFFGTSDCHHYCAM